MSRPALLLPIILFAAKASGATPPIVVTGHAWAPFISPMGEPFRARTADDDTLARWFGQADLDHDGMLAPQEMQADADRFFARLDTDHNGEIDPDELADYEWDIAPDIQIMSRTRRPPGQAKPKAQASGRERWLPEEEDTSSGYLHGLQGAARYAILNIPEPVAAADANFDRIISLGEFRIAASARFQLLDTNGAGKLALEQLQNLRTALASADHKSVDTRIGNPLPPGH